jgi:hypothetical protein
MDQNPKIVFQKLVTDQDFIEWVKNPTPESDRYWEKYVLENPDISNEIRRARYIIQRLQPEQKEISRETIQSIWNNVNNKKGHKFRRLNIPTGWLVAASVIILVGLGSLLFFQVYEKDTSIEYKSFAKIQPQGNEVKLILSDQSEKLIQSKEPAIEYNRNGEIKVDSESLSAVSDPEKDKSREAFNQLVVPKGKRSSLTLSDGSRIFLNSGSRVIYPVVFGRKTREIYVEGEMYLQVAKNPDWPFIVVTDQMKVKVLGTEFNVKAYPDETSSSVVLVKGSVQAIVRSGKIVMKENEMLTLSGPTGETSVRKVDVLPYVSWKDGWMYCNNERMESVAQKLSRYYDIRVTFKDPQVRDLMVIGKLDLKSEYRQVFDVLGYIASVKYTENEGNIIISMK